MKTIIWRESSACATIPSFHESEQFSVRFFEVQCVAILIGAFNFYRLVTLTHLSMGNKETDIKTQCDIELDNFIRIYMSSCRHWNISHLYQTTSFKSMFKTVNRMIPKWTNTFYIGSHRYTYIVREEKNRKRARTHWKTNELIYLEICPRSQRQNSSHSYKKSNSVFNYESGILHAIPLMIK